MDEYAAMKSEMRNVTKKLTKNGHDVYHLLRILHFWMA